MQKDIKLSDVSNDSIKEGDYITSFWYMSQDYAIDIIKSSNLDKEVNYYECFYYI